VQQLAAVVAPRLLGGMPARTPLAELGLQRMADAISLTAAADPLLLGPDLLWRFELPAAAGFRPAPDGPDPP
jgi:diaminohydroxyphosphoribosylaminopyrimidine deaminase/5-amino-6-(5-phosphoribosylamino)uracil reductase